jgi:hypothetical protein
MSEYNPDSPKLSRLYCPGCEPEADPSVEILEIFRCSEHTRPPFGLDDMRVTAIAYISGTAEAGGDDNRRWCDLFHGKKEAV